MLHVQSLTRGRASCKTRLLGNRHAPAKKKPGFGGTNAAIDGYFPPIGRFAMNTLKIQDSFEPYYDGRKTSFARIDPRAVTKAKDLKDRLEDARKAKDAETRDRAA
jgi:hypothetical protein